METAQTVVNDILQEILVQANEQPIEAVDFQFVVRYMNRYMAQLAVRAPIGYTKVSTPNDYITVPDGALEGIIYNVALKVLNSYDIDVGPTLYQNAAEGLDTIYRIAENPQITRHPSTLPLGSGNECGVFNYHFYPGEEDTLLTEQNGNILLENSTNEQ